MRHPFRSLKSLGGRLHQLSRTQGDCDPPFGDTTAKQNSLNSSGNGSGAGLRVLVVLIDAFVILIAFQLMVSALARLDDRSPEVLRGENNRLKAEVENLKDKLAMQFLRIATLEEKLKGQSPEASAKGEISTLVITRSGEIILQADRGSPVRRLSYGAFARWLRSHRLEDTVNVAGEKGADYERVTRVAGLIQRHNPNVRIFFGAGIQE